MSTTIEQLEAAAYRIPTDAPEADGTLAWDSTTLVLVRVAAQGVWGCGYSYTDAAAGGLIQGTLADIVLGRDAMAVPGIWEAMVAALRNLGRPGLCSSAVAAVDTALWDLKARLLGVPLADLLGSCREPVPVYGSGGFTSYSMERLLRQMADWVSAGIPRVKMKVGAHPGDDVNRVAAVRKAIGTDAALYVDANGAYARKQALEIAVHFREQAGVSWFEEPVSSDDLAGLRLLRDRVPPGMEVTAGEYGYDLVYFRRMLAAGAVDVIQADATRCGGITGLLRVAALARAFQVPLSSHTAPALHLHPMSALPGVRHMEYFHDHVRIEERLFDGAQRPRDGALRPVRTLAGHGLNLRTAEAARYAV
ncbi:MAG: enolase C-terminal domain-like protein [Gammaproteobacteria bacterium]